MRHHNVHFGQALRELRLERGKTQEVLAFECGLDRTYISLLELGRCSPTLDTLLLLAKNLDVSFADLASRVELKITEAAQR